MKAKKYQKIESILSSGFGQKRVAIRYRNSIIIGHLTDMELYDCYQSHNRGWKKAGNIIYDTVIRQQNESTL